MIQKQTSAAGTSLSHRIRESITLAKFRKLENQDQLKYDEHIQNESRVVSKHIHLYGNQTNTWIFK